MAFSALCGEGVFRNGGCAVHHSLSLWMYSVFAAKAVDAELGGHADLHKPGKASASQALKPAPV
jgi:hypothetical protein